MERFRSEQTRDPEPRRISPLGWFIREVVVTVLPALIVALFVNVFVAEAAMVEDGPSMEPNLYRGYRMMTEKVSYYLNPPSRGDIVILERPNGETALVKRVLGLPGEVVEVRAGHTYINDQMVDEPWATHFGGPDYPPTRLAPDQVFILGDNRAVSYDSRMIGPVSIHSIQGRVWFIYWPLDQFALFP
jgi:signal peptidase I